ncbi:hypothetical protein [Paraburkholderia sp. J67]|uniref:hypothetical protein n=1 Tax=Paraburkholderia sp. J67 TaxID=2805435 RepID=UPI002ABE857A|nr:hypothetical protein [Paraburkholderia sp. J67]
MNTTTHLLAAAALSALLATSAHAQLAGSGAGVGAATAGAYYAGAMVASAPLTGINTLLPLAMENAQHSVRDMKLKPIDAAFSVRPS